MFGGSADVCASVYELAIQLASEGRHVQSFLTILERPGLVLAVSPSSQRHIRRVEDLKGAVVGISTPGSASHLFLNYLLRRHLVPLQDVSVTSIGLGALSIAAFRQGRVDAAVLAGSGITAAQHRFPKLFVLADARTAEGVRQIYGMDVYPAHDLLAQTEWVQKNPESARKLTAAVMKSMRYMKEHSPEEIRRHMPAQYRVQDESADLDALRATVPMISRDGKVTPEEARAIKDVLAVSSDKVRNSTLDLEATYSNKYLPVTSPLQTR
jgi:NitT/TauT family transport system substrate-binding protein